MENFGFRLFASSAYLFVNVKTAVTCDYHDVAVGVEFVLREEAKFVFESPVCFPNSRTNYLLEVNSLHLDAHF